MTNLGIKCIVHRRNLAKGWVCGWCVVFLCGRGLRILLATFSVQWLFETAVVVLEGRRSEIAGVSREGKGIFDLRDDLKLQVRFQRIFVFTT